MERDMALVRQILKEAERADGPLDAAGLVADGWTFETVAHHVQVMADYSLVSASVVRDANGEPVRATVRSLTWEGHDFLDAVRDERVWVRVREAVAGSAGSVAFDTMKRLAGRVAEGLVSVHLGL